MGLLALSSASSKNGWWARDGSIKPKITATNISQIISFFMNNFSNFGFPVLCKFF